MARQAGTVIFSPTHGIPGTMVTFQGVDWYLPDVSPCRVDGTPVKIDVYAVCEVRYSSLPLVTVIQTGGTVYGQSPLEPSGTFVVANVPPGTYPVTVTVNSYPTNPVSEQPFTVDGSTSQARTTTETITTTSPAVSQTSSTTPPAPTMTLTAAEAQYEMLNYPTIRATLVALGAMIIVLATALILVLRRTGRKGKRKSNR